MSKAVNHEAGAYEKMIAGLRHAEEAAVELAHHRSDRRFMIVSIGIQRMREKIIEQAASAATRVS